MRRAFSISALFLLALAVQGAAAAAPVKVVTTLPAYASIAQFVGGDRVQAQSIARGDEDAHFVKPKRSYALMLKRADLFVTTGLDLELWAPVLVDKSGNARIREGQPGYVNASQGVPLVDVPRNASRAGGDIHLYGNPHIHTSPINAKVIARNIAAGLKRVDPQGAAVYDANLGEFNRRIDRALYGDQLPQILGSATLDNLARQGKLISFLQSKDYKGKKLIDVLGGWLGKGMAFRGKDMVTYHQNWAYFTRLFGLDVVGDVEPKPGIPPSAKHVHELIEDMKEKDVKVVMAPSYYPPGEAKAIAQRTGADAIIVPLGPDSTRAEAYFGLIDGWVNQLARAYHG
ncbi:MAG TPA: metal ABC transporter substrate-binding protein [Thermoanaerobaculia bacterium]|nr:metal ABC transporter substrate-binding protein [Thermoanaerobaculia bacterium]